MLDYLILPAIKPGKSFVYRLWKALLHEWLSYSDTEVYLVTPFLDEKRMTDICRIVIEHSGTANIKAFYVRETCCNRKTISSIIETVKKKPAYKTQPNKSTVDNKIFKKIRKTTDKYFHAKLIACTYKNNAMVLVTSANFSYGSFDYQNYESVVYREMTTARFLKRFIEHLNQISD